MSTPETHAQVLELGLNIDMTDADRLRSWARLLATHGPDITHWTNVDWLTSQLTDLAARIAQEVTDVGHLRAIAALRAPVPQGETTLARSDQSGDVIADLRGEDRER